MYTNEPPRRDYKDEDIPPEIYDIDDKAGRTAIYDSTSTGALMLSYEKDDAFTSILRGIVDEGFMTWQRNPFCWIIDGDFAEDVLAACKIFWDYVEHGTIT